MLNNGYAEHVFYALCVIDFTRTLTFIDFQGIEKITKKKFTVKTVKVISKIVFIALLNAFIHVYINTNSLCLCSFAKRI